MKARLQTQMATTKALFTQKQDSWAYLTKLQTSVNKIITTRDQIQLKDDQWNTLIVHIKDTQALQDEEALYDQTANHAQTGHLPLIQIANEAISDYKAWLSMTTIKLTMSDVAKIQATAQSAATQATMAAQAATTPPAAPPTIKAPDTAIPIFLGDPLDYFKWRKLWDTIIQVQKGDDMLKMSWLVKATESVQATVLPGLLPSAANYQKALDLLHKRFGDESILKKRLYTQLSALQPSGQDAASLRSTMTAIEVILAQLETLKEDTTHTMLLEKIWEKFPDIIKLHLQRWRPQPGWDVRSFRDAIDHYIREKEEIYLPTPVVPSATGHSRQQRRNPPTNHPSSGTPSHPTSLCSLPTGQVNYTANNSFSLYSGQSRTRKCIFDCNTANNHYADDCPQFRTIATRKMHLKNLGRCIICSQFHPNTNDGICRRTPVHCVNCCKIVKHHRSLCYALPPPPQGGSVSNSSTTQRNPGLSVQFTNQAIPGFSSQSTNQLQSLQNCQKTYTACPKPNNTQFVEACHLHQNVITSPNQGAHTFPHMQPPPHATPQYDLAHFNPNASSIAPAQSNVQSSEYRVSGTTSYLSGTPPTPKHFFGLGGATSKFDMPSSRPQSQYEKKTVFFNKGQHKTLPHKGSRKRLTKNGIPVCKMQIWDKILQRFKHLHLSTFWDKKSNLLQRHRCLLF